MTTIIAIFTITTITTIIIMLNADRCAKTTGQFPYDEEM
jgi:hypothetical protein